MINLLQALPGSKIPVIVGPTGVGKTSFSIQFAEQIAAEIISIDSRQIYRGFKIGTAQPTAAETKRIPHHLVNMYPADKIITAGDYVELVNEAILNIRAKKKMPLLCGGTLLYVQAICHGIIEDGVEIPAIRKKIDDRMQNEGAEKLYQELVTIDPDYANLIHSNDIKRIARAHEIYRLSGKAPTDVFRDQQLKDRDIRSKYFIIGLKRNRQDLYRIIDQRVETMISEGWLEEVRQLLTIGIDIRQHAMQSVGYRQLAEVIEGDLNLEEAVDIIKQKTRQFAKRQLTWLRKMDLDFEVDIS